MDNCYDYSLKWRYGFNPTKSGVVTFGKDKQTYKSQMSGRAWKLGSKKVAKFYEYKNLGVTENFVRSSASNIDNITEKTRRNRE